ncbi:hypothetical protein CA606_18245 [Caulobacter vibrioides]|uniref:Uncharacterized protein n=1 Tax=Caulobacter vibrioides TaxID=155892 RepID=A0A290MQR6_CAUVI|nr:hypothetical protein [Caulobacter vibrioides]ATC34115.1 hypothetical protein CA606_18245 [Caulobacter vibrioides]
MEEQQADPPSVNALIEAKVAEAVATALAARDEADRERLAAAEAARLQEVIARAFSGLLTAIDAAGAVEADRQAALAQMFGGLASAVEKAIELERVSYAARPLKVALFDPAGRYCGFSDHRADLTDQLESDPFTRLAWRPEWDDLEQVEIALPSGRGTGVFRLAVPDLADIPGGLEEAASQRFADYPVPDLT